MAPSRFSSLDVPDALLDDKRRTNRDLLVYIALTRIRSKRGEEVRSGPTWPDLEEVADFLSFTVPEARKALAHLIELGHLDADGQV